MKHGGIKILNEGLKRDRVDLLESEFVVYRGRWAILFCIVMVRLLYFKESVKDQALVAEWSKWHIVSLDGITRSVHTKFNCIAVNSDRTQDSIYMKHISYKCNYKQLQTSSLMGMQTFHIDKQEANLCFN